ncbi:MAG: hypothetical protein JWL86_5401 [Rhizobium sp.]|nr:hypothetical protein [Rhizobium sp.]
MSIDVVYDLGVSPSTYDFVSFLLASEMERLRVGADSIRLHILPGPAGGFRADLLPPFTIEERQVMLERIVLPMAKLLPSCTAVTRHSERPSALAGCFGYGQRRYSLPFLLAAARAGVYPLRAPGQPVKSDPYITITLREAAYWPTRNSNPVEWMQVAQWLRSEGWRVVIVRDTARAHEVFGQFEVDTDAALDLHHRASLYSGAALNLFTNNGPAWMCLFMGAPCMVVKMTADDAPCVNDGYLGQHGFLRGSVWPNLLPMQSVEWLTDRADEIIPAVAKMLNMASADRVFS